MTPTPPRSPVPVLRRSRKMKSSVVASIFKASNSTYTSSTSTPALNRETNDGGDRHGRDQGELMQHTQTITGSFGTAVVNSTASLGVSPSSISLQAKMGVQLDNLKDGHQAPSGPIVSGVRMEIQGSGAAVPWLSTLCNQI